MNEELPARQDAESRQASALNANSRKRKNPTGLYHRSRTAPSQGAKSRQTLEISYAAVCGGLRTVGKRATKVTPTGNTEEAFETMTLPNNTFHLPLHPLDSETQTHGCRHTNPSVCAKHSLPGVCAFVRKDDICLSPPQSWSNQFQKLFFKQFGKRIHNRPA
jgi:hypothetical protein